jgi:ankyrin repeat protein
MSRIKQGLVALALVLSVVGIVWVAMFKQDYDLLKACERCDAAEVERLLASGADPNAQRKQILRKGKTALMLAASCDKAPEQQGSDPIGDPRVVKLLLEKGADLNKGPLRSWSVLHFAVGQIPPHPDSQVWGDPSSVRAAPGHPEVVRLLLDAGADVNAGLGSVASTPLDWAMMCNIECGNRDVVRLLIEHGARSDSPYECNYAGTAYACGWHDLVELYIERGCNANSIKSYISKNPYLLVRAASHGDKEVVRRLLEVTPKLHEDIIAWAVHENCLELMKELLDRGIDPNCRFRYDSRKSGMRLRLLGEKDYVPIIYVASSQGYVEMTGLLIERGADVNARAGERIGGWGPLDAALSQRHGEVADILRAHGAQEFRWSRSR